MKSEVDLEKTLNDVREAYRLLFAYQNLVLDLMRYIGEHYGLKYTGGNAKFSNSSPRYGKGSLKSWSWDWLNMYFYQFTFEPSEQEIGKEIYFSILLQSDTGYFDSGDALKDNKLGQGRCDLGIFEPAKSSKTLLHFIVRKANNSIGEFEGLRDRMALKPGELGRWDDAEGKTISKAYILSSFVNEKKTLVQLQDFRNTCSERGVELPSIASANSDPDG